MRRQRFTLIELLVAMTILSMVVMILLYITQSVQRSWKWQEGRAKIYQNSRVLFDIIERDIRSMVVSSAPDQPIPYHLYAPDPNSDNRDDHRVVTLVSSAEPNDNASCRLCEVTYRFKGAPLADLDSMVYCIERQSVCDDNGDDWDFYDSSVADWFENKDPGNTAPWETVVCGISEFTVAFYDSSGTRVAGPLTDTTQPVRVVINAKLFDEAYTSRNLEGLRVKTERAFTKILYLSYAP